MPSLITPPNPAPSPAEKAQPVKLRTGRFGELEEHELIHLLDSLDDERSKSRFRESIYISLIVYVAIAWFIFYGPRILFHQPDYKDFVTVLKERDKSITYVEPHVAPKMPTHSNVDTKTLKQLQQQKPRIAPAAPAPVQAPAPAPAPAPVEQARTTPPPPLPAAPTPQPTATRTPQPPLVDAPTPSANRPPPNFAQNAPSAHDQMQSLTRGGIPSTGRPDFGGGAASRGGPLQAGASIISDTEGVDFTAWLRRLHNDIQRNWDPLIPESVQPPLRVKGIVGIRFTVMADGSIGGQPILETRSGDVALDKAAWNAIISEGTYPPLPHEFHGKQIDLRLGFFYNIVPPQ